MQVQAGPHRKGDLRREHAPGAHASQRGSERGVRDGGAAAVVLAEAQQPSRVRRQTLQRKRSPPCTSDGAAMGVPAGRPLVGGYSAFLNQGVQPASQHMICRTSCRLGSRHSDERTASSCSAQPAAFTATQDLPSPAALNAVQRSP